MKREVLVLNRLEYRFNVNMAVFKDWEDDRGKKITQFDSDDIDDMISFIKFALVDGADEDEVEFKLTDRQIRRYVGVSEIKTAAEILAKYFKSHVSSAEEALGNVEKATLKN